MVIIMIRLCFLIITLCSVSIAINRNILHGSAGCPLFNFYIRRESTSEYPLHIPTTNRISSYGIIGASMIVELRGEQSVQASRHHIIPYSVIRDFFNRLLDDVQHPDNLRTFANALIFLSVDYPPQGMNDRELLSLRQFIHRIRDGTIDGQTHRAQFTTYERNFLIRVVQAMLLWMPGNIFIGPQRRHDDPESGFEHDAQQIVDPINFRSLEELFCHMMGYLAGESRYYCRGRFVMVDISRAVDLIRTIDHLPTLFHDAHWWITPSDVPIISWDGEPNVRLNITEERSREKRQTCNNESCERVVQKITTLPDQYCHIAQTKIVNKVFAAIL